MHTPEDRTMMVVLDAETFQQVDTMFKERTGLDLAGLAAERPEELLRLCHGISTGIAQRGASENQSIYIEDQDGKRHTFNRQEDGDVSMHFLTQRRLNPLLEQVGVERDVVIAVKRRPTLREYLQGRFRRVLEEKVRAHVKLTRAIAPVDTSDI